MAKYKMHLLVCGGTACRASESENLFLDLKNAVNAKGLENEVQVITTGCFGFCEKGPIVKVMPDNTFYTQVKPADVNEIVEEHVIKGRKVTRLLYVNPETEESVSDSKHMGFYRKQIRIALRNCGFIDPENIDEYIGRECSSYYIDEDGYATVDPKAWDGCTKLHQWVWFQATGERPECVCHKCDNRCCGNLNHLFGSTPAGNSADMVAKDRASHIGRSTFTDEEVREIRWLCEEGPRGMQRSCAKHYGVSEAAISNLVARKTYSNVIWY